MMSAVDCSAHADHCEALALASADQTNHFLWKSIATQWRKLANGTADHERMTAGSRRPEDSGREGDDVRNAGRS
jgi:hypothetical protein